jgi:hypothetical protein
MKVVMLIIFAGLFLAAGCAPVGDGNPVPPPYPDDEPYVRLSIPPGHLPPPGECRIWEPGRPAGHQLPPGPCPILAYEVPSGAWLLSRPEYDPQYVKVSVYHYRRLGVVEVIRYYDVRTGRLVWERKG